MDVHVHAVNHIPSGASHSLPPDPSLCPASMASNNDNVVFSAYCLRMPPKAAVRGAVQTDGNLTLKAEHHLANLAAKVTDYLQTAVYCLLCILVWQ